MLVEKWDVWTRVETLALNSRPTDVSTVSDLAALKGLARTVRTEIGSGLGSEVVKGGVEVS